jgi:hypothetical protein
MNISLPEWYDGLYEFECEFKGCLLNVDVTVGGQARQFTFYDPARFLQEMQDEIRKVGYFSHQDYFGTEALVILPKVTRENIRHYLQSLE